MSSFVLPIRIIAIAAYEAARIHDEKASDAFDDDCPSRARWLAIEAIRRIYPLVSQASVARQFGFEGDAKLVAIRMANARLANWWRDENVSAVAQIIAPHSVLKDRDDPHVILQEDMAARVAFKPRPRGTPIATVRNVTALLMGDPPPGRRELLAATQHNNFAFVDKNSRRGRL